MGSYSPEYITGSFKSIWMIDDSGKAGIIARVGTHRYPYSAVGIRQMKARYDT
jgi:hypothetical protein